MVVSKAGNFITYDNAAVRLWSLRKQVKSWRPRVDPDAEIQFSHMSYLDALDCCVIFYTPKKGSESKGGKMFLITSELFPLQEIPIKYWSIYKICTTPSKADFALLDEKKDVSILHLEILQYWNRGKSIDDNEVLNEEASITERKSITKAPLIKNKPPPKAKYISISESQFIEFDNTNQDATPIRDMIMVTDRIFATVDGSGISLYHRSTAEALHLIVPEPEPELALDLEPEPEPELEPLVEGMFTRRKRKEKDPSMAKLAEALKDPDEPPPPPPIPDTNIFEKMRFIPVVSDMTLIRPNLLLYLGTDKLLIGFDDGCINILEYKDLLNLPKPGSIVPPADYDGAILAIGEAEGAGEGSLSLSLSGLNKSSSGSVDDDKETKEAGEEKKEGGSSDDADDDAEEEEEKEEEPEEPQECQAITVCKFQAHCVPDGYHGRKLAGIIAAQVAPWRDGNQDQPPFDPSADVDPSNPSVDSSIIADAYKTEPTATYAGLGNTSSRNGGYVVELATVGTDMRIAHWGLVLHGGEGANSIHSYTIHSYTHTLIPQPQNCK